LHSNGQLSTERDGDTEKECKKPAVEQKMTDDDGICIHCDHAVAEGVM